MLLTSILKRLQSFDTKLSAWTGNSDKEKYNEVQWQRIVKLDSVNSVLWDHVLVKVALPRHLVVVSGERTHTAEATVPEDLRFDPPSDCAQPEIEKLSTETRYTNGILKCEL